MNVLPVKSASLVPKLLAGVLATGAALVGVLMGIWLVLPAAPSSYEGANLPPVPHDEHADTIAALSPPKRARPVIAVLGHNDGTETTDFMIPYAVLKASDAADVFAVAPEDRPIRMTPALTVMPQETLPRFDARFPDGADYVVVAAMHPRDDPEVLAWIRSQADSGALIIGVCSGVRSLAAAGLLRARTATGYWYDRDDLRELSPTTHWITDRRYVADGGIVTTTGISASMPISLALVEAIAGRERAAELASTFGVEHWDARHDATAFGFDRLQLRAALGNKAAVWGHETIGVPVGDGADEVEIAFRADAWARTFRSRPVTVVKKAGPVALRHGLVLVPDEAATESVDVALGLRTGPQPARALEESLAGIANRYGDDTARFVATQLEYPWSPGMPLAGVRSASVAENAP
jgi:transcriptional regulator GlxA family with amidase domain